jgi:tRNA splicing endonuclease
MINKTSLITALLEEIERMAERINRKNKVIERLNKKVEREQREKRKESLYSKITALENQIIGLGKEAKELARKNGINCFTVIIQSQKYQNCLEVIERCIEVIKKQENNAVEIYLPPFYKKETGEKYDYDKAERLYFIPLIEVTSSNSKRTKKGIIKKIIEMKIPSKNKVRYVCYKDLKDNLLEGVFFLIF